MRRKKLNIREALRRYGELYRSLYRYRNKLSIQISKINSRLKNLEEKVTFYKERGELDTAVLYAREYKNLYIVREVLWHVKLNIEGVLSRIDTIKIVAAAFEEFDVTVNTLTSILKDSRVAFRMFSEVSNELLSSYNDIRDTFVMPETDLSSVFVPTEDALEILKGIERKVGEELSRKFPSVPAHLDKVLEEDIESGIMKLYQTIATDGGVSTPTTMTYPRSSDDIGGIGVKINIESLKNMRPSELSKIEKITLNYLLRMSKSGIARVNIYNTARLFRITPLQILDVLYSLCEQGLIQFV